MAATSCAVAIACYALHRRGAENSALDDEKPPQSQAMLEEGSLIQEMSHVGLFMQGIRTCIRAVYLANMFLPLCLTLPLVMLFPSLRKYWWRVLRRVWMLAGGCWIKYGQWASTRPDIFSAEVLSEFVLLQDQCLVHSLEKTRKIIKEECGAELEEIFSDFNPVPIASGTIAQVYSANLRLTGQRVAIKVVHPGVEKVVLADLWIMSLFAKIISCFPNMKWMSLEEATETFKASMLVQLNMRNEARSLSRFQTNFRGDSTIVFPRVIDHMCGKHVLIETYEGGVPMNAYLVSNPPISERKRLAQIGLRAYLTMLLLHNFIHADLHPGNILVRKLPDNQLQLVLLDFGLICQLSEVDWCHFKQLFKCIVQGDGEGGARLMIKHARQVRCSPEDQRLFVEEINKLFKAIRNNKLSNIQVGLFLSDILNVVRKYQIKIESNFSTLCVATVVLEGIGRQLDPDINILNQSVPILLWSEKAGLDDRMVFLRERLKDDFIERPGQKASPLRGIANVTRYAAHTIFSSVGYDIN